MKNLIFSLAVIGLLFGCVSATYEPTSADLAQVEVLKTQLDNITTGDMKDKRDFYAQLRSLQTQYTNHEQLKYYFDILGAYLLTQVNAKKIEAKTLSKASKQDFVNQYSS